MILLDTNILIEILKNNQKIIARISSFDQPLGISVVTAMELIVGARNKQEVNLINKFISKFQMCEINSEISFKALELIGEFAKSHTLDIPDSLIAATAISNNAAFFTLNVKDFRFIPLLELLD